MHLFVGSSSGRFESAILDALCEFNHYTVTVFSADFSIGLVEVTEMHGKT